MEGGNVDEVFEGVDDDGDGMIAREELENYLLMEGLDTEIFLQAYDDLDLADGIEDGEVAMNELMEHFEDPRPIYYAIRTRTRTLALSCQDLVTRIVIGNSLDLEACNEFASPRFGDPFSRDSMSHGSAFDWRDSLRRDRNSGSSSQPDEPRRSTGDYQPPEVGEYVRMDSIEEEPRAR